MTQRCSLDVRKPFGLGIQRWRRAQGLVQEELAHRADIDRAYLSRIENGNVDVGLRLIVKLASALEVAPAELLKDLGAHQG